MSRPHLRNAAFPVSGDLFGLQTAYPARLGSIPDAAGLRVRRWVFIPCRAGSIPARRVAIPACAGAIPAEMGWLPGRKGIHPAPEGMKPAAQGIHPAPPTSKPAARGIKPARRGMKPARRGMKPKVAQSLRDWRLSDLRERTGHELQSNSATFAPRPEPRTQPA